MVRELNLLDLPELITFVEQWENDPAMTLRNAMLLPNCYILSPETKQACLIIEGVSKKVAKLHVYTDKKFRGKQLFAWAREVQEYLKQLPFKYILNYTDDPRIVAIVRRLGSKELGDYRGYKVFRYEV